MANLLACRNDAAIAEHVSCHHCIDDDLKHLFEMMPTVDKRYPNRCVVISKDLVSIETNNLLKALCKDKVGVTYSLIEKNILRDFAMSILSPVDGKYDRNDMVFTIMDALDHVVRSTSKREDTGECQ